MRPFEYLRAGDAEEAVALMTGRPGSAFLAGGTNLVDLMKLGALAPEVLVDVSGSVSREVEDLPDGGLRVGAGVPNSELAADRRVRERYPALSRALLSGASGQLRNRATTAGNLLQRTRCVYFQDVTTPCNKRDPGSGCSALEGHHREHAILGHSESCVATHPSDMAVAMSALGAVARVRGPEGEKEVPVAELHRLPGEHPEQDTVLGPADLITAVDLPPLAFAANSTYRKVRDRASYAFALVSVAAVLDVEGGGVRSVRIALGGVAHKPWRAERAERELRGAPATEESYRRAAEAELAAARPLAGNAYKVKLARELILRALLDLTPGAESHGSNGRSDL